MLIEHGDGLRRPNFIKTGYAALLFFLFIGFASPSQPLCGTHRSIPTADITYYLYIEDFIKSFIEIPTSDVLITSTTIASSFLAGRAPIYNMSDIQVGTCSASFLSMQTEDGIYTDIANYLSSADGLVVTWFTPTTLINLELDNIINSMVTECTVVATTKVGLAPLFGQTFDLIVSSDGTKIYFQFTRIDMIF